MSPKSVVLFSEDGLQLRVEKNNALVLTVLCEEKTRFRIEFTLNSSERESYKREGDEFIKGLGETVRNETARYASRGRVR
ncbi:MAG: hypothetical protein AB7O59_07115 [Pirellulales bacterium]